MSKATRPVTLEDPSDTYLLELGRAANKFGQLEHMLKLVIKRKNKRPFLEVFKEFKRAGLGALLSGISEYTGKKMYVGLIEEAKNDQRLKSITQELEQTKLLVPLRNTYIHGGVGKNSDGKFQWLSSEDQFDEAYATALLKKTSEDISNLINKINGKIRP